MTKNTSTPSNRLGNLLQEAREKREMTLGDVAGITHVRKEYLQAIDEGRWNDLPENVYTRNFLRLYASAVGVEEAAVLNLYGEERYGQRASKQRNGNRNNARVSQARGYQGYHQAQQHYQQGSDYGNTANAAPVSPRRSGGRWVAPLLLTVILAGLGIFAWQNMAYTDIVSQATTWYQQQTWLPWVTDSDVVDTNVTDDTSNTLARTDSNVVSGNANIRDTSTTATANNANATDTTSSNASTSNIDASNQSATDTDNVATNANSNATAENNTSNTTATANNNNLTSDSTQAAFAQNTASNANDASTNNTLDAPASGDMPPPNDQVLLSIVTEPEGANASLDGFLLPSRTPVDSASVNPGRSRLLSLELDGYVTSEQTIDLTLNRDIYHAFVPLATPEDTSASDSLEGEVVENNGVEGNSAEGSVLLTPDNAADGNDTAQVDANADATDATADAGNNDADNTDVVVEDANTLVLQASEAVWLEVYTGSARGEGERIAYRMLEAGESISVPTPVYVHAGNSQALQVRRGGQDLGAHGDDVTGKLYP